MKQFINGSYAVLYRELLLLRNKLFDFGHVFYMVFSPVIYLAAFGLGLGSRIDAGTAGYSAFLLQGIACMTSMNNSYSLVTSSVSMGRLLSGSFQTIITSPVKGGAVMTGLVLSGILRGFAAVAIIIAAGWLLFGIFPFGWMALPALLLNTCFFSALGVIIGIKVNKVETNAFIANFIIMPMAFFSGTFYPVDYLPEAVQRIVYFLPLNHTNILMRSESFTPAAAESALMLAVLSAVSVLTGAVLLARYRE